MADIQVRKLDETTFEVIVQDRTTTTHIVKVTENYARQLINADTPVEQLVHGSFNFLLAREPNTSILRNFDLSVIARYFPEYERVIGDMLDM